MCGRGLETRSSYGILKTSWLRTIGSGPAGDKAMVCMTQLIDQKKNMS